MTDDELREWIEAEHQLTEVESTVGGQTQRDLITSRIADLQRRVLGGNVASIEDYKSVTSEIRALQWVLDLRGHVARRVADERTRRAEANTPNAA